VTGKRKFSSFILLVFISVLSLLFAAFSASQALSEVSASSDKVAEQSKDGGAYKDEKVVDPRSLIDSFFVGTSTCVTCHEDLKTDWLKTAHALTLKKRLPLNEQGCEMCHGPGQKHLETGMDIVKFDKKTPLSYASICLSCHVAISTISQWKKNPHSRVGSGWCTNCHDPHKPNAKLLKAVDEEHLCARCHEGVVSKISASASKHAVFESKMLACTSCHNPHKGKERLLKKDGISQTCGQCHEDKTGPFTFEHVGMEELPGTDACLTCHDPHGSPNTNLLLMNGRGLCLNCHQDRIIHKRGITCWSAGCHTQIHGSNTNPIFLEP